MSLLGFGQPQTGIFQMAYVVEDLDASMRRWIEQLHVGPWFLLPHFTGERGTYRGAPAEADVALSMAWAGAHAHRADRARPGCRPAGASPTSTRPPSSPAESR